jgi:mono/diheme cytochrome c family protein
MREKDSRPLFLLAFAVCLSLAPLVSAQGPGGERDAGGFKAPTAALERGRAVYVLNTCHFCHGVDLTKATMGAAVLLHSPLVGADEQGNIIGPIVRAGFPNLQTSMPSYPDLTPEEVRDLAAYIHYLRQLGRRKELLALPDAAGEATQGKAYFAANCAPCHSVTGDLKGVAARYSGDALKGRLLGPAPPLDAAVGGAIAAGRARHLSLLERYQDADVHNLLAYLRRP